MPTRISSYISLTIILSSFLTIGNTYLAHSQEKRDSSAFEYRKIYSWCLDANVKPVLELLADQSKPLSSKDNAFKTSFENRFGQKEDQSGFISGRKSPIDELLKIYQEYWRSNLLQQNSITDSSFIDQIYSYLKTVYPISAGLVRNEDSIDVYLRKYLNRQHLYTTGLSKTGRLYDLLVWRKEVDTTYQFTVYDETASSRVILMDNFITLGWEEYATLGRYYPGGWATRDALYCVAKAYDLKSERFLISYLCHESRHFADYQLFPKLQSADLEYRAKLMELSIARETIYALIEFFISNANYESENGHSVANYCVIRDLSKNLFQGAFEKDINKWKQIPVEKINLESHQILEKNTKALIQKGNEVERFIK